MADGFRKVDQAVPWAEVLCGAGSTPDGKDASYSINLLSSPDASFGLSRSGESKILTSVNFSVQLKAPAVDSKGISELSGVLECTGAGQLRTVNLIAGGLRDGAKGTEFDTRIDELRTHVGGGDKIVLRTRLAPEQLWSVKVTSAAGETVPLERRSVMTFGDERVYTYVSARSVPRSGTLVAKVFADAPGGSPTLRIPFSATNLSLLGQPLAVLLRKH